MFTAGQYSIVYVYHVFFSIPLLVWIFRLFPISVIMNSAAVSIGVNVSFQAMFFPDAPSGTAGSLVIC